VVRVSASWSCIYVVAETKELSRRTFLAAERRKKRRPTWGVEWLLYPKGRSSYKPCKKPWDNGNLLEFWRPPRYGEPESFQTIFP
jgi:hypothetical protein